jgi:pyrophosphatase PpaX
MKKYQYILFDWDGNLAKTLDLWQKALRISLERRGHFLSDKEIGANLDALKERLESQNYKDVDAIISEASKIATQLLPSVELYPDALVVVEALSKASKQVALVTTSHHTFIDPLLKKYNLAKLFDIVVCGDDVSHHKPHPEPILKAITLLNGKATQTVMIGDSSKDIEAAKSAGVDSILFYPTSHERFHDIDNLLSFQPTHIVTDFREILKIV